MQKNLYYQTVLTRKNLIGEAILNFFLGIGSYPRLIIEVFIRRNMGERYFTLASAITVGVILFFIPFVFPSGNYMSTTAIISNNIFWYLFLTAYAFCSFRRYQEVRRNPSVFDFGRYSKTDGELLPVFTRTKYSIRQQEVYLEPATVLAPGLLLLLLGQYLPGTLFCICAIVYSLSKAAAYREGDHFIMDKIDELLCNTDLRDDFLGKGSEQSEHGFKFRHYIPTDPEQRGNLFQSFFADEEPDAPLAY